MNAESRDPRAFLAGGGEMAALMRAHDWSATPLGPPETWPQALKTSVRTMLTTRHPVFVFWGPDHLCLYNDAYRASLGPEKHPAILGIPGRAAWPEIWDIIEPQIAMVMRGEGATWYENALVPILRHGAIRDVYWTYSYGPIDDDFAPGGIGGVLVLTTETTEQVLAAARLREAEARGRMLVALADRLRPLEDAHAIMAAAAEVLGTALGAARVGYAEVDGEGWAAVYREWNPAGLPTLIGRHRLEDYGPARLADMRAGRTDVIADFAADPRLGPADVAIHHRLGIHAQVVVPLVKSGRLSALLFVHAAATRAWTTEEVGGIEEVAERTWAAVERARAEAGARAAERRRSLLAQLTEDIRDARSPDDVSFAAAELLGRALGVSRAGYGTIDTAAETITIARDWNAPGIRSLAGVLRFRDYGSYIEDLKRGETVVFADARTDPRTAATAGALEAISARAVVNMPVSERGGLVALLYLNHAEAREWTPDELSLIREVAERTRTAVERRRAEAARQEGDARFRLLFDALDAGFCVAEVRLADGDRPADYRIVEANPAFARHTGLTDVLGRWIREAVPGMEEHWFQTYAHVAETGEAVRFERGAGALDGRWFDVHAFRLDPLSLDNSGARQVAIFFNDISDRRRAETRLAESEARFRNVADHAPVMMWVTDPTGRCIYLNRLWYEFTGQTEEEAEGFGWLDATHPEDKAEAEEVFLRANAAREPFRLEYRLRRADGRYRLCIDAAAPRFGDDGTFLGYVGSVLDIEDRREAEERQSLLMREVDHRAKNALAVVQATLRLTRADDVPGFVRAIEGRVGALARAQTLLADDRWAGADLHALLEGDLAPFLSGDAARVRLSGPRVALPAGAAQPLAMAVHELATNALKYGALSRPTGRVVIAWRVTPDAEEALRLEWVETGGPPVTPPARRGFGSRVLDGTVASQLGGTVVQDWRPGGLVCTITFPLARARAAADADARRA